MNKTVQLWLISGVLLTGQVLAAAGAPQKPIVVTDGPYVEIQKEQLKFSWICHNQVSTSEVSQQQLPYHFSQCGTQASLYQTQFGKDLIEYQGDFKVAALSDLHGQYDLMMGLLSNNNIINAAGHWAFGDGHFVITGDVFDRGDKVTEILWFLHRLEQEAEKAGGKLHLLLGNHEVMVLNGDLRYLNPKYVKAARLLGQPFSQLLADNTVLGRWLRSKSVLVKINGNLYAHGGFHPSLAVEKRSLVEINQVFKQNLVKAELVQPRQGWGKYLHKTNGPIWYRGYFKGSFLKDSGASTAEIDLLLSHFDVKHLIVGHTSQDTIETRHQGKVIAIDSSIKNGENGEILLIDGDKKWRGLLSGERLGL